MDALSEMRSVVAVAEAQSFTGAAHRLNQRTQWVSKQVQAFEKRLGARLFDRTTRRVRMTELGQTVVQRCQQILTDFEELQTTAQLGDAEPRGKLKISAPVTFGEIYLAPLVGSFCQKYPEIEISLFLTDRYVNLIEEGVDAAVRIGRLEDSSMGVLKLAESQLVCLAHQNYLQQYGHPQTPQELSQHRCILDPNLRGGGRWLFNVDGEATRVAVQGQLSVNSARAASELAQAGQGLAYLPRFAAQKALEDPEMQQLLADYYPPALPIQLLFPHARMLSHRLRALGNYLKDNWAEIAF